MSKIVCTFAAEINKIINTMNINLAFAEDGVELPIGTIIKQNGKAYKICPLKHKTDRRINQCEYCHLPNQICDDIICNGRHRHDHTDVIGEVITKEGGEQ